MQLKRVSKRSNIFSKAILLYAVLPDLEEKIKKQNDLFIMQLLEWMQQYAIYLAKEYMTHLLNKLIVTNYNLSVSKIKEIIRKL